MALKPRSRVPRPAPASMRGEVRGDIPMARAPFENNPWGPYDPETPHKTDILTDDVGPVDVRGASDWRSLKTIQCGDYAYGQIIITCDAQATTSANGNDLPAWPHVEIRLVARTRNQVYVLLEAAAGSHGTAATSGPSASAGPVFMPFAPGEVPDSVEILARARRGGLPETTIDSDERLNVFAAWRFHL